MEPHLGGHGESDKILLHNINEFCQDDYGDDLLQNLKCRLVETFVTHCHSKENGFSCDSDGPKANSDHQYELFANKVIPESFLRSCLRSILHPVPIVMRSFTCIAWLVLLSESSGEFRVSSNTASPLLLCIVPSTSSVTLFPWSQPSGATLPFYSILPGAPLYLVVPSTIPYTWCMVMPPPSSVISLRYTKLE